MTIYRGEDRKVQLTLTDKDDVAIATTSLDGAVVYLKDQFGTVLQQYSLNTSAGYEDIEVIDAANGIIQLNVNSDDLLTAQCGTLFAEVKIQTTDADFDGSSFHNTTVVEIDDLRDGVTDTDAVP